MKAVTNLLYLCGGLMAAAAVMGTIDYKVAEHKGSLKKLYKEEERPLPFVKKTIDVEDYSRGEINMPMGKEQPKEMKVAKKEKPIAKPIAVKHEPVVEEENEEEENGTDNERKSIRLREFSRAPLPRKHYKVKETIKTTIDTLESKAWDY